MVIETFVSDPVLQDVLIDDCVGALRQTNIMDLDPDYDEFMAFASCFHGYEKRSWNNENEDELHYDVVPVKFVCSLANKCDIYTGVCDTCGRRHVAIRPYKPMQKRIKGT
jgi:hypothetical protein